MSEPVTPPADYVLSKESFTQACAALPLVSIDLMITRPGALGDELLLGLRNNRPAQGWWFTPGGRIRKNEALQDAMLRIAADELNLSTALLSRTTLLGAWDHFYPDSAFSTTVSTHYVNLAYALHLDEAEAQAIAAPAGVGEQHSAWQWMPLVSVLNSSVVHHHVRLVAEQMSARPVAPPMKP
jgi:colanic acid biosynthesis protein WcaH